MLFFAVILQLPSLHTVKNYLLSYLAVFIFFMQTIIYFYYRKLFSNQTLLATSLTQTITEKKWGWFFYDALFYCITGLGVFTSGVGILYIGLAVIDLNDYLIGFSIFFLGLLLIIILFSPWFYRVLTGTITTRLFDWLAIVAAILFSFSGGALYSIRRFESLLSNKFPLLSLDSNLIIMGISFICLGLMTTGVCVVQLYGDFVTIAHVKKNNK